MTKLPYLRTVARVSRLERSRNIAGDFSELLPADSRQLHLWPNREHDLWLDRSHYFRLLLQSLAADRGSAVRPACRSPLSDRRLIPEHKEVFQ